MNIMENLKVDLIAEDLTQAYVRIKEASPGETRSGH